MKRFLLTVIVLLSYYFAFSQAPHTVRYDLYVSDSMMHNHGKMIHAMVINGGIPAPVLTFTEGDTAEIYVHNKMDMETSVHWHGLILPNRYDGVSYLTTAPIKAGETHLYKFLLVQNGTYWYHSHTMFQEQSGMYGAFIIKKRNAPTQLEHTLLLSDWTNENPAQVDRSLHMATDWYAVRKNSVQSYTEAIKAGRFSTKVTNEWKRMLAMDVSDVYYDQLFSNGKPVEVQTQFRKGDKVRLRVVNGSSSTYFWLKYAGGKITVVANDGMDVEPVIVDRLIVGVAETYDVEVDIPADSSYEFLATAEDRTRATSVFLGNGPQQKAEPLPRLRYFDGMKMMNDMMKMNGQMNDMGMSMSLQQMDMNAVMYPEDPGVTLNYAMLKSPVKTTLPEGAVKELHFNLTGNMNRYVWTINNKTVSESDKILIKKGENVRIVLYNGTMMRHPMHLHGHFFRVLNGQGEYSPLKNTLDIMPMETDTLEFAATESGDWFFHCHILYHMMSGMGRIFSYQESPPNPEIPDPKKAIRKIYADDRKIHAAARIGLESNSSDGEIVFANTRYRFQTEWRAGYNGENGYETESHFGRYLGQMQWLFPYIGWDMRYRRMHEPEKNLFGQVSTRNRRNVLHAGLEYTLPMLIIADASVDTDGRLRFQLSREDVPITRRLRFNFMANTDKEYMAGFRYIMTKYFSLSSHYDSDMGLGAGITITY
ncbi:multicopper oxidase domain-containing protein [Chitinophaga pinensis]|uniref:L-ascorbate oxidase n=1 Tax=Chitinophaga pinensis (strain ATCC 43595 / DSM 2588 / LMG 13176 / NBRC 15968 / NCIMB 11800 / UQM 2034) TaxID=485918 RepID=A0A979G2L9_CHIPD|nr:multicopper oxidase domain-containing protein [Chitinophaga pinensis]ACU59787.1 L-ascorbate oxidase [Chitinophaga pinensis DSM 2588]